MHRPEDIPHGARIYLRPVGPDPAPGPGKLPLAGGFFFFHGVDVMVRLPGEAPLARWHCPAGELEGFVGRLPEPQATRARATLTTMQAARPPLAISCAGTLSVGDTPRVMGIVNVTPDSFSDGGRHAKPDEAIAHGKALIEAGADILDIGGESTRPGAETVWPEEERRRVLPVIEGLADCGVPLSIDTRRAAIMAEAVAAGATMINDVSGLTFDPGSVETAARLDVPVCMMHSQGTPQTMQQDPQYRSVTLDVYDWLEQRLETLVRAGLDRCKIVLDPGIGFGKTVRHNLDLIDGLGLFHGLGAPLLLGASRKRFIGALSREEPSDRRLGGSLAVALAGWYRGVQIMRVHDVAETVQALTVARALRDAGHVSGMGPAPIPAGEEGNDL